MFVYSFDLAHDVTQDFRLGDGGYRHFDALLDGDGLRAGFDRTGVAAHAVGGGEFGCSHGALSTSGGARCHNRHCEGRGATSGKLGAHTVTEIAASLCSQQ